jgi:tetratricopeptide (TPR) repeat protein
MKDEELIRTYVVEIEDLQKRGEYSRSYERTKQVLSLCERSEIDLETRCEILILAARSAYYVTSFDEALRLCSAAEDLLAANDIPARAARLFASALVRANVSRRRGNLKEALAILEPHRQSAAGEFPPALVSERLLIEGACRFYLNEIQSAEESLEAALGLAIHYADTRVKSRVLIMLGLVAQNKGLHEAALEYFDRAKDLCHADADHYGEAAAALDAGILLYRRGRFSSAETRIERAREIFASIGWSVGTGGNLRARCGASGMQAASPNREDSPASGRLPANISATCISIAGGSRPRRNATGSVSASRRISRPKGISCSRSKEGSASSIVRGTIPLPPCPICAED